MIALSKPVKESSSSPRTHVLARWAFAALLIVFAGVLIGGCGDDELENNAPPVEDPKKVAARKKLAAAATAALIPKKPRDVPSWNAIRPYFLGGGGEGTVGAVRGPVQTLRDPFEPLLVKWVPHIEVEDDQPLPEDEDGTDDGGGIINPPEPVADKTPLEKFKVQDYRVLMIRWGTSVNKAVVVDPEGTEFIVTRDMKIGNNNGRIVDITQYQVMVREDSREEVIPLSILPELRPLGEDAEQITDRLFKNQTTE